jgi:tRNA(Ile)-lysidine synthase
MTPRGESILLDASRHALSSAVEAGLREAGVGVRDRLLLGVSGGADSTAMLVGVAAVRARSDPSLDSLTVLACDHGLRPEARAECDSVLALCRELGISASMTERLEVARDANLLAAAREARLRALWRHAQRAGAAALLLGHHADDLAEGLLLALARGEGLDSARTLLPRRDFDQGALCRPLLRIRRRELRQFLRDLEIAWHEDPSNAEHARGTLRSDPSLAGLVDRIAAGSGGFVREAVELIAFRDELAERLIASGAGSISQRDLDAAPLAVRAAALVGLARRSGGGLARSTVEDACLALDDPERRPRVYAGRAGALHVNARTVSWVPETRSATAD